MNYRSSRRLRRVLFAAPLVLLFLGLAANPAMAATGLNPLLPDAVSPNGHDLYVLYNIISIPALFVFVLVEGLLLIIIVRDRRSRRGPDYQPPQTHGNRTLEIAWTVAPTILLIVIGALAFNVLQANFVRPADAVTDQDITIEGHQFGWTYTYLPQGIQVTSEGQQADANPLVIPTGKLVRLRMQSRDVIHSWWVPELMGKTDLVPGYDNFTWVKVAQPGEWRGECAELCGSGHYTMQIRVRAVTPDDFDAWVAQQKAKAVKTPTPAASPSPSPSPSPTK